MSNKARAARAKDITKFSLLVLLAALAFAVWVVLTVERCERDAVRWAAVVEGKT